MIQSVQEMDQFLQNQKLPRLHQWEVDKPPSGLQSQHQQG